MFFPRSKYRNPKSEYRNKSNGKPEQENVSRDSFAYFSFLIVRISSFEFRISAATDSSRLRRLPPPMESRMVVSA